ncbi:MAG: PH domain-containing protein [Patescibacteria group bacterium]
MFHIEDVLLLTDDEHVKTVARRHIVTLFPRLFLALLLLVLPFFLLFPLFQWGVYGILIFFFLFGFGVVLSFRTLFLWDSDVLIVTNCRVVDVDQRGLFSRMVSEAPITTIQNISWIANGPLDSLFGMGTLRIELASGTAMIEASRISHAKELHQMISGMRNAESPTVLSAIPTSESTTLGVRLPTPDSRLHRIVTLLESYSEEDLARIETVLNARKP